MLLVAREFIRRVRCSRSRFSTFCAKPTRQTMGGEIRSAYCESRRAEEREGVEVPRRTPWGARRNGIGLKNHTTGDLACGTTQPHADRERRGAEISLRRTERQRKAGGADKRAAQIRKCGDEAIVIRGIPTCLWLSQLQLPHP